MKADGSRLIPRKHTETLVLLTRIEPAYGIFVLRFRPKKQQFSVALPTP